MSTVIPLTPRKRGGVAELRRNLGARLRQSIDAGQPPKRLRTRVANWLSANQAYIAIAAVLLLWPTFWLVAAVMH